MLALSFLACQHGANEFLMLALDFGGANMWLTAVPMLALHCFFGWLPTWGRAERLAERAGRGDLHRGSHVKAQISPNLGGRSQRREQRETMPFT